MTAGETSGQAAGSPARFQPHESFFAAQKRNRRATWRMTAVCAAAAILMGIPLTLVITPAIYAFGLIAADVVNQFYRLPPWFWSESDRLARLAMMLLFEHKAADMHSLVVGASVLLGPGCIFSLALWLLILRLFRRAGVGGTLLSLKTRAPDPGDNRELQFNDIVEEMAIAARLPRPRALVVAGFAANAAAIGTSPDDACIVVSQGLLSALNREELEAVVAHLMASVGDGDLAIAFAAGSIFETCGLLETLINAPFDRGARATLWRLARFATEFARNRTGAAQEAEALEAILARNLDDDDSGVNRFFNSVDSNSGLPRRVLWLILFPIFLTNISIQLTLWFFSGIALGPAIAMLWRTRRYLADAAAVQFTRDPDGLAGALEKLNRSGGNVPGAEWCSHLFFVSPARGDRMSEEIGVRMHPGIDFSEMDANARAALASVNLTPADLDAVRRGDAAAIARVSSAAAAFKSANSEQDSSEAPAGLESRSMLSFHPAIKRRLARLQRMGAQVQLPATARGVWVFAGALGLILGPLALLAIGLFVLLIAVMICFNLLILVLWLAAIHAAFGLIGA
jgi:Zn-dependent protease with chaperone function